VSRTCTAGLSIRSVALYDALRMLDQPIVEVHLTNVFDRESLYRDLLTAAAAWGFLAGFVPRRTRWECAARPATCPEAA
jgi:3-dehydroquinate dehydratase